MNYTPVAEQNNVVNLFLPITNSEITGINIINIQVDNNNFLDVTLNAIIGPNSSISIIKPGINLALLFLATILLVNSSYNPFLYTRF